LISGEETLRYRYLGHLEGVVMVAYNSLAPDVLGGADFDGDIVKIFNSDELRNAVLRGVYGMEEEYDANNHYNRILPIIKITPLKSDSEKVMYRYDMFKNRLEDIHIDYEIIFNTFSNKVGQISNMAIMLGKNQYWSEVKDDNISAGCEICTILTGLEIDACKTGIHPKFNSIFKKNDVEYLKEFKPFLDELQYITWKNFKMNESGDICKYVVNGESKVEVKKDSEYILQNLAFEFMKIGISRNEEKETTVSDDIGNNVLFTFEKEKEWEANFKDKNKTEIDSLKNLLKAHKYAAKLIRSYNKMVRSESASNWRKKILKIWLKQKDGNKENISEYGVIYLRIINYIEKYIDKSSINDKQKELMESEWPYLYHKKDKYDFLLKFFNISEDEMDEIVMEHLCDFKYRGYSLLYLFLKEVENRSKFITFKEAAKEYIETNSKELDNLEIKEHLDKIWGNIDELERTPRSYLLHFLRKNIKEKKYSFELMYYVSKNNQNIRDYFWEYYSAKDMLEMMEMRNQND
jgi:hypothetical protein